MDDQGRLEMSGDNLDNIAKNYEKYDEPWVILETFSNRMEAEVIRGLLQSCGIASRVIANDVGGVRPHLAVSLGVTLLVPGSEYEKSKLILKT